VGALTGASMEISLKINVVVHSICWD
jgi:hypothetical protein